MHSFRLRLILALIAGVTLVSVASTYFEVLAHKHVLREELERRSSGWAEHSTGVRNGTWQRTTFRPATWPTASKSARPELLALGVYDPQGKSDRSLECPSRSGHAM